MAPGMSRDCCMVDNNSTIYIYVGTFLSSCDSAHWIPSSWLSKAAIGPELVCRERPTGRQAHRVQTLLRHLIHRTCAGEAARGLLHFSEQAGLLHLASLASSAAAGGRYAASNLTDTAPTVRARGRSTTMICMSLPRRIRQSISLRSEKPWNWPRSSLESLGCGNPTMRAASVCV